MVVRSLRRFLATSLIILFLCSDACQAQSLWDKAKEKASAAWNSDLLNSRRYTVPVTERRFINVIPDSYLQQLSDQQYRSYISGLVSVVIFVPMCNKLRRSLL